MATKKAKAAARARFSRQAKAKGNTEIGRRAKASTNYKRSGARPTSPGRLEAA